MTWRFDDSMERIIRIGVPPDDVPRLPEILGGVAVFAAFLTGVYLLKK